MQKHTLNPEKELDQEMINRYKKMMKQNLLISVICAVALFSILLTNLFTPDFNKNQLVPIALCVFAIYISRVGYFKAKTKLK